MADVIWNRPGRRGNRSELKMPPDPLDAIEYMRKTTRRVGEQLSDWWIKPSRTEFAVHATFTSARGTRKVVWRRPLDSEDLRPDGRVRARRSRRAGRS